jgi:hypothetical protein
MAIQLVIVSLHSILPSFDLKVADEDSYKLRDAHTGCYWMHGTTTLLWMAQQPE